MNPRPALLDKERKPDTWPLRGSGVMNQNLGPFNLAILSGQIQRSIGHDNEGDEDLISAQQS
jgi:hypothetical protein